jgi:hypothetical protein
MYPAVGIGMLSDYEIVATSNGTILVDFDFKP